MSKSNILQDSSEFNKVEMSSTAVEPDKELDEIISNSFKFNGDAYSIKENSKFNVNCTNCSDNVNHPSHYTQGKIECIEAMQEAMGIDAVMNFCQCNAFKYIWRSQHKNGYEDIRKAIWYCNKYLELAEKKSNNK
jgi:hypothetical protein